MTQEPKLGAITGSRDMIFSEEQAAAFLQMTPRMLADRRRAGKIRCIKDGRFIAYTTKHFAEYLNVSEKRAGEHLLSDTSFLLEAVKEHLEKTTPKNTARRPARR